MANDDTKSVELKLVLSSTGDTKLTATQREIRLVIEAAEKGTQSMSALSLAMQKNFSNLELTLTKLTSSLGLSFQRSLEQAKLGFKGTEESMVGAVTQGNLLATVFTRLADHTIGKVRQGFNEAKHIFAQVTGELEDQVKQIVRTSEAYERFQISIENAVRSQERASLISNLAFKAGARSPFGVADFERGTSQLLRVPAIRAQLFGDEESTTKRLNAIYDTVTRLASLDPERGVPGAVFAFRLALQGQFRALTRQYNISVGEVVEATGRSAKELKANGALLAEGLGTVLKDRVTDQAISRLASLPSAKISNLKEYIETIIPRTIGQAGFRDSVQDVLGALDEAFLNFVEPGGPFEKRFAPKLSDALTRILGAVVKGGSAALGVALDFSPGEDPLSAFFLALEKFAEKAAKTAETIANTLSTERGQKLLTSFFDTVFNTIERFVNALFTLAEQIPNLLPFFGQALQVVSLVAQGIAEIVKNLGTYIDDFIERLVDSVPGFRNSALGQQATAARNDRNVNEGLRTRLAAVGAGTRFERGGVNETVDQVLELGVLQSGVGKGVLQTVERAIFEAAVEESRLGTGEVDLGRFAHSRARGLQRLRGRFETFAGPGALNRLAEGAGVGDLFSAGNPSAFAGGDLGRQLVDKLGKMVDGFSQAGGSGGLRQAGAALRGLLSGGGGTGGGRGRAGDPIGEALAFGLRGFREAGGDLSSNASLAREGLEGSFFSPTERAAQAGEHLEARRDLVTALIEEAYSAALATIEAAATQGGAAAVPGALAAVTALGAGKQRALGGLQGDLSALNLAALSGGIGSFLQIDPRDTDALKEAATDLERLSRALKPITLDTGAQALLGGGNLRKFTGGIFGQAGGEFRRQAGGLTAFGGGINSEIAQQRELARLFETESGYLGDMLGFLRALNLTTEERALLEARITLESSKQTDEIRNSLAVLERKKRLEAEDRQFEDQLFNAPQGFEQETRLGLVGARLRRAQASAKTPFAGNVFDEEGLNRYLSFIDAEEERVRTLSVEYRNLQKSIAEADNARAQSHFLGKTGAGKVGSALDIFEFDERTGKLKGTKSLGIIAEEGGQQFGVSFATGLQSGLGGSLKGILTGDLDSAAAAWNSFFDSLLTAFTDTIAKMVTQAAFAGLLGGSTPNFLGALSGTLSGSSGLPGVGGAGFDVDSGILGGGIRPNALGGIVGYSMGGRTGRSQIIRVGEGGMPESIIPSPGGVIPLVMTANGPAAHLPGGRLLPAQFVGSFANGGQVGGGSSPTRLPTSAYRGETLLNVVVVADAAEITRRGLASNADAVVSIGAGDMRNQGKLYRASKQRG